MPLDPIRLGVLYYSAGHRVPVEKGMQKIGDTTHDAELGQQAYWWPSLAKFQQDGGIIKDNGRIIWPKDVFEIFGARINNPVPVMELVSEEKIRADEEYQIDFDAGVQTKTLGGDLPEDASEAFKIGFGSVAGPPPATAEAPPQGDGQESPEESDNTQETPNS